MMGVRPRNMSS